MITGTVPAVAALDTALRETGLHYEQIEPGVFGVQLPGEQRLRTTCWLTVGRHALAVEAFVMRRPDENGAAVHSYLLQRNTRSFVVSWAIDEVGDIYLAGRLPLSAISAEEIDRVLGSVLTQADGHFNALLELGFGTSIRREWQWREKNNESLRNLEAFRDFVARQPAAVEPERRPAAVEE
ncbi:MAG: YbjN domain-containing protein [bacterium]